MFLRSLYALFWNIFWNTGEMIQVSEYSTGSYSPNFDQMWVFIFNTLNFKNISDEGFTNWWIYRYTYQGSLLLCPFIISPIRHSRHIQMYHTWVSSWRAQILKPIKVWLFTLIIHMPLLHLFIHHSILSNCSVLNCIAFIECNIVDAPSLYLSTCYHASSGSM